MTKYLLRIYLNQLINAHPSSDKMNDYINRLNFNRQEFMFRHQPIYETINCLNTLFSYHYYLISAQYDSLSPIFIPTLIRLICHSTQCRLTQVLKEVLLLSW